MDLFQEDDCRSYSMWISLGDAVPENYVDSISIDHKNPETVSNDAEKS